MKNVRGIIFDIDGVLEFQGRVYPGAVETLETLRSKGLVLRFLTNSTLKSRDSCAARLRKAGFQAQAEEVITASYATARYLRELGPRSCWVMQEREGMDEFRDFPQDTRNPEYLVVGDNRSKFDFEHLNKALRLLRRGAKLIGMTPQRIDSSMGELELNVGSWVEMLAQAAGVKATYVGKPHPYVFELTLGTMSLDRREVIVVGDQVNADIKGAKGVGVRSILLRTGEFEERDLDGEVKPDFTFDSIQEILSLF